MDLKTLKDFEKPEFEDTEFKQCWSDGYNVCLEELKAEAIKWVKNRLKKNPLKNPKAVNWQDGYNHGYIASLKEFFNIIGKDLK